VRRAGFFAPGATALGCAAFAGAVFTGFAIIGPFNVLGTCIALALEKPPGDTTLGGITITFADWAG
jgi:hypothetical protein